MPPFKVSKQLSLVYLTPRQQPPQETQSKTICSMQPLVNLQIKLSGAQKPLVAQFSNLSVQVVSVGKNPKTQPVLAQLQKIQNGSKKSPALLGSSQQQQHKWPMVGCEDLHLCSRRGKSVLCPKLLVSSLFGSLSSASPKNQTGFLRCCCLPPSKALTGQCGFSCILSSYSKFFRLALKQ